MYTRDVCMYVIYIYIYIYICNIYMGMIDNGERLAVIGEQDDCLHVRLLAPKFKGVTGFIKKRNTRVAHAHLCPSCVR